MSDLKSINMLVSFADLSGFGKVAQKLPPSELIELLTNFYSIVVDVIESNEGEVIKFIGDSALLVFNEDKVDQGVRALLKCKQKTDKLMKDRDHASRLIVTAHFGEVVYGKIGTKRKEFTDVMGDTVNTAGFLKSNGFAMTPQVFRKLKPDTRKLFKKHTPPITYIPVTEFHKD